MPRGSGRPEQVESCSSQGALQCDSNLPVASAPCSWPVRCGRNTNVHRVPRSHARSTGRGGGDCGGSGGDSSCSGDSGDGVGDDGDRARRQLGLGRGWRGRFSIVRQQGPGCGDRHRGAGVGSAGGVEWWEGRYLTVHCVDVRYSTQTLFSVLYISMHVEYIILCFECSTTRGRCATAR